MNKFIKFFQWLDSNRVTLVSEVTTLPTEPQPLPEVIKLFVYRSSLRRALEHFARIPWVSIFIFDQLKVVVYPTPRRPSAPSHSKATIGAMVILALLLRINWSYLHQIQRWPRLKCYQGCNLILYLFIIRMILRHIYYLPTYLLTYLPTYFQNN